MVVHRGSSWDASPDTSHRSSLQTINQNTPHPSDTHGSPNCKHNPENSNHLVEWVSFVYYQFIMNSYDFINKAILIKDKFSNIKTSRIFSYANI